MKGQINPKILGSIVIGFALTAGAYTITHFGEPSKTYQSANIQGAAPTQRVAIQTADADNNGIEDWRDEFVTTETIILDQDTSEYTPPETLTGQLGIGLMENIITAHGRGPLGKSNDEIIKKTVDALAQEAVDELYDTADISVIKDWNDDDIVNYANSVANIILSYNKPGLDWELNILHEISTNNDVSRIAELQSLAEIYRNYRDETLKISAPAILAKEHLDLINTYNAVLLDIESMTLVLEDPTVTLLRLKRYEDDATGLNYALQNMLFALLWHAPLFGPEDSAMYFVSFHPDYQS